MPLARIVGQEVHQGVGAVIDIEELAFGRAAAPDRQGLGTFAFGLMGLAQQRGRHVAVLQVEVVTRAEQVGRHGGNEIVPELAPVGLTQLDAGDLGHRVPLVGGFERAGQKRVLGDRLRGQARIDARGPQQQQLSDADPPGRLDHVGLDRQVVVEEVRGPRVVGQNPAHRGRGQDDPVGPRLGDPILGFRLAAQIDDLPAAGQNLAVLGPQAPDDGGADHAAVSGDPDALALQREGGVRLSGARHHRFPGPVLCFRAIAARSTSIISRTRSWKPVVCCQPSSFRALLGSPSSAATSVGRK